MDKQKWFAVLVLVALLLSAALPSVMAQKIAPRALVSTIAPTGPNSPVDELQDMDLDTTSVEPAVTDALQGKPGTFAVHTDAILGLTLRYPRQWKLAQDEYLFRAYGFSLTDENDHLVLSVGWLHESSPADLENEVREVLEGNPGLNTTRTDQHLHQPPGGSCCEWRDEGVGLSSGIKET